MRTILSREVPSDIVTGLSLSIEPSLEAQMSFWSGPLLVLWLYLPGYLANTAAMLGGKWIPDMAGIKPRSIDGGRRLSDGHRILGDGKTWNGLAGAIIGAGFLCMFTHWLGENSVVQNGVFLDPLIGASAGDWFWIGGEWGCAGRMTNRETANDRVVSGPVDWAVSLAVFVYVAVLACGASREL